MHRSLAIAIVVLFSAPAAPARAQTIVSLLNYDSARAGLRVGYGGHGLDLQIDNFAVTDDRQAPARTN